MNPRKTSITLKKVLLMEGSPKKGFISYFKPGIDFSADSTDKNYEQIGQVKKKD